MQANLKALESRQGGHPAISKYDEIAQILTGNKNALAQDGLTWVTELARELNIPPLSMHGLTESRIPEAVEKTMKASSTKGNPIALNEVELKEILERAL